MAEGILLDTNDLNALSGNGHRAFVSAINSLLSVKSGVIKAGVTGQTFTEMQDYANNFNDGASNINNACNKIKKAVKEFEDALKTKLAPAFEIVADTAINVLSRIQSAINGLDFDFLITAAENAQSSIEGFIQSMGNTGAFKAMKQAFNDAGKALAHITGSLSQTGALETVGTIFGYIVTAAAKAISVVSQFVSKLDPALLTGIIAGFTSLVLKFMAFKTLVGFLAKLNFFNIFGKNASGELGGLGQTITTVIQGICSSISTLVQGLGTALSTLVQSIGTGISTAAQGIGTGLSTAFQGLGNALQMANPANLLALGAAIAMVTASFALLGMQGEGIATIILAIGQALACCAPLVQAIGAVLSSVITAAVTSVANALLMLAPVFPIIASSLAALSPIVLAFGEAFSMVIGAISTAVSQIIEALTPVIEIIANVFTQCVSIITNAIVSIIAAIAPFMPNITTMVTVIAQAAASIAASFTLLFSQVSPILDSLSKVVSEVGGVVSEIFEGIGEVITRVGDAISGILDSIAGIIDSIGTSALNAGKGFKYLAEGLEIITGLNIMDMAASLAAVAGGLAGIALYAGSLAELGTGMLSFSQGLMIAAANGPVAAMGMLSFSNVAVPLMNVLMQLMPVFAQAGASMQLFSAQAVSAAVYLGAAAVGMAAFAAGMLMVNQVTAGSAMGLVLLSAALASVTVMAQMAAAAVQSTVVGMQMLGMTVAAAGESLLRLGVVGEQMSAQLVSGVQSGMNRLMSVVANMVNSMTVRLNMARTSAYLSGIYIGQGLAVGLNSQVGAVREAAARLAAAADAAIRAKARIHSPSKVSDRLGQYWGEGFANGIAGMIEDVYKSAKELVMIPALAAGESELILAGGCGSAELSDEYSYNHSGMYTLVVPLDVDGREVARATAVYTQEELNRIEMRNNRKAGRR